MRFEVESTIAKAGEFLLLLGWEGMSVGCTATELLNDLDRDRTNRARY